MRGVENKCKAVCFLKVFSLISRENKPFYSTSIPQYKSGMICKGEGESEKKVIKNKDKSTRETHTTLGGGGGVHPR